MFVTEFCVRCAPLLIAGLYKFGFSKTNGFSILNPVIQRLKILTSSQQYTIGSTQQAAAEAAHQHLAARSLSHARDESLHPI